MSVTARRRPAELADEAQIVGRIFPVFGPNNTAGAPEFADIAGLIAAARLLRGLARVNVPGGLACAPDWVTYAMLWMAGAAGAALEALAALQKTLAPPAAATADKSGSTAFALAEIASKTGAPAANTNAVNAIAPDTLGALISLQGQPGQTPGAASSVFSALDGNGDGQLSQAEFTSAFSSRGAANLLDKLLHQQTQSLASPGQALAVTT